MVVNADPAHSSATRVSLGAGLHTATDHPTGATPPRTPGGPLAGAGPNGPVDHRSRPWPLRRGLAAPEAGTPTPIEGHGLVCALDAPAQRPQRQVGRGSPDPHRREIRNRRFLDC